MGQSLSKKHADEICESPYVKRLVEARQKLTGWERVQLIFQLNEYGDMSPEIQRVITGTTFGVMIGAFIGAMGRGKIAYQDFMRSNAHEVFETPLVAKRKLQDSVTLGMFSGSYRIGWRIGLFTGIYLIVSTGISTYRGKMGIMDQVVGGGTAGFLYKFPHGPKPAVAGGAVGLGLGLFAGCLTAGLTRLTGQSIDEANLSYYHYLAKKEGKKHKFLKEQRDLLEAVDKDRKALVQDTDYELTSFHDKLVAALSMTREIDEARKANKSEDATSASVSQEDNSKPSSSDEDEENNKENNKTSTNKSNSATTVNVEKG